MAILMVNGVGEPTPSKLTIGVYDVSSTADRNAKGNVVIDRVATKRKLEMEWAYLTPTQMSNLLTAIGAEVFFSVTYPDPVTGGTRTMSCYAGDRTAAVLRVQNGQPIWTELKMNWIER